ncbi:MAG: hypothetical protein ABI600_00615 [Luteolibacter sp.]
MERKNLAVELLERLLKDKIRSQTRNKERRNPSAVSMGCQC